VAAECNLYTPLPGAPAVPRDHEQWFARWEAHFASVWPGIFDRGQDPKTRSNLASFLATLLTRHPGTREIVEQVNKRLLALAQAAPEKGRIAVGGPDGTVEVPAQDILVFAGVTAGEIRTDWLRQMAAVTRPVSARLFRRPWGIVFADTDSFITSDNPVAIERGACRRKKFGISTPGTLVCFPISPQRFLVIADEWEWEFMHYKLDDPQVFVRRVVNGADRFVFARQESHLIVKAIAARRQSAPD
jgi:Protein of unknown function (DUF4238)